MTEHTVMTRRFLRAWRAASADDMATGLVWYGTAGDLAESLAAGAPISRAQAAGVIASLSMGNAWGHNVRAATEMIAAYANGEPQPVVAGYPLARDRAWAILQAGALSDPLDILRGPKVTRFYRAIMGDPTSITVDRWMVRLAYNDPARGGRISTREYREIEAAIANAAELAGVAPRDFQAAVWTYYRRAHARTLFDPTVEHCHSCNSPLYRNRPEHDTAQSIEPVCMMCGAYNPR